MLLEVFIVSISIYFSAHANVTDYAHGKKKRQKDNNITKNINIPQKNKKKTKQTKNSTLQYSK